MSERRRAFVALAATLAIQIFTSLAATATAVLAPEIAATIGVAPKWIGVFIGIVYAGAMLASLACGGYIERYGAIRVSQIAVLLCVAGLALIAMASGGGPAWLAVAALVIGLGYGPITPSSSHVLIRTAPRERLALTFSIKQTGVPAGAALAGAALPGLSLFVGWRSAFLIAAALGLLVVIAAQPTRRALDADRHPERSVFASSALRPLRLVWQSRALIELALISFVYAATQVSLTSFLVVHLHETLEWSLVAAGLALTVTTLGGVIGRIGWGMLADRALPPRRVLAMIGLIACACGALTALASSSWPVLTLLAVAALFGATAIGWNGVQLAEVARLSPAGSAGAVTGATGFITISGVVVGPPGFALLATTAGGYRVSFATFALLSGLGGLALLVPRRMASDRGK